MGSDLLKIIDEADDLGEGLPLPLKKKIGKVYRGV